MKNGFSLSVVFRSKDNRDNDSYCVTLWKQPWTRYILAQLYHWYDMRIYKVPGFKKLERWAMERSKDDWYIPWSTRQDIRCYHLMESKRETLAILYVDEQVYNSLKS